MPSIANRMTQELTGYDSAQPTSITTTSHPPPATSYSNNLMSSIHGNIVPMRGILPIEQMSDTDIQRFFPYSAYSDRIPKFTYYALLNQGP
jgi:hypothetical protein